MPSKTPPFLQVQEVPQISTTPAPTPSNEQFDEVEYFSTPRLRFSRNTTPGSSLTSPLALPPASPERIPTILKTPPTEIEKPGGNFFATTPIRRPSHLTRTTTPSDNVSSASCLTPNRGSSYHSSELGRSTCSGSSSEYLSPPLFQADNDNPPYKARRGSAESLTMVRTLRRANTEPDEKNARKRLKRHSRKRHKCKHKKVKMQEHRDRSYWWLPGCQLVPTAPRGQKDMGEGHGGRHTKSKLRYENEYGPLFSGTRPAVTPVTVPRRWSSVEVGAHQIISEMIPGPRPPASFSLSTSKSDMVRPISPFGPRFRSSSFTRGVMDNDIVRLVRDRLALKKIPSVQLKAPIPPASIILRRASVVSSESQSTQSPNTIVRTSEPSGGSTPLARLQGFLQQRRDSTYLITSQDIDSIAELIEENLKKKYERMYEKRASGASSGGSMSPTITSKGVILPQSYPDQAMTVAEAQTRSTSHARAVEYLQVDPGQTGHGNGSHISSPHSPHSVQEVIWQGGGGSPQSTRSISFTTDDDDSQRHAYCDCSQGTGSPEDNVQQHQCKPTQTKDRSDAFDPKNAKVSINEWSMRCPQNEIALVVTSSDSESYDNDGASGINPLARNAQIHAKRGSAQTTSSPKVRPRVKRPSPRSAVSDSNLHKSRSRGMTLEDVVSFPPLPPRKTTEEWFSPLPEMITTPPLTSSRCLYEMGLDANLGPSSSNTVTPKASQSCLHFAQVSPTQSLSPSVSIEFRPGWDLRKKSMVESSPVVELSRPESSDTLDMRKKSVVKTHPTAKPRAADLDAMGSSIGSHCHERKRSSVAPARVQRVRTIDNVHKGERDAPSSKWRPPSVCPSRQPSTTSETEAAKVSRTPSPKPVRKWGTGLLDRVSLMRDRCPPQPTVDAVGIYGQLTGTKRRQTLKDACLLEEGTCQPHDCDDCTKDSRHPSVDWIG